MENFGVRVKQKGKEEQKECSTQALRSIYIKRNTGSGGWGMKRFIYGCLSLFLIAVFVLPVILVKGCEFPFVEKEQKEPIIKVYDERQDKLIELPIEEYIKGVVAAEMPAEFDEEALKAQALASRTFTLKRIKSLGGPGCGKHEGADICNDIWDCQAWMSKEELKDKWGTIKYIRYWNKISDAVESTKGEVITFQGELIDAVFHSTCGGYTENSEDVWTNVVPYLRGKECGYCTDSPRYFDTLEISLQEFTEKLGLPRESVREDTASKRGTGIKVLEVSPGKRVKRISIGGVEFKGSDLRTKFPLRSTRFDWEIGNGKIEFRTQGNGHGVGMCQFGADGMADAGFTYQDIIKYYYTGVEISDWSDKLGGQN